MTATLPTLAMAAALAIAAPADADVASQTYSGADLALIAGQAPTTDGRFVLNAGEVAELYIPAPDTFRSMGAWWYGSLGGPHGEARAFVELSDIIGSPQQMTPLVEYHDLSALEVGATGPAGEATIGSLTHSYQAPATGATLWLVGPVALEEMTFVWIQIDEDAPDIRKVHPAEQHLENPMAYPKPSVSSRASWGAHAMNGSPTYCTVTHVGVHHTASSSDYLTTSWQQSANNVKSHQEYHMFTRGWKDIGYNFLIDKFGNIFEGRYGGDDVVGAHDGWNCGSMGVSLMGYFHTPYNNSFNFSLKDALSDLAAWKCDQRNINPTGSGWYAGYGGTKPSIYGHRDVSATACPGDLVYSEMGWVRNEVADRLNSGGGGGDEITLDTPSATFTQSWTLASSAPDKYGADYRWRSTGIARGLAYWQPNIPSAGNYDVYFWWADGWNRNPSTTVGVRINGRQYTRQVNQQTNGGRWNYVGTWNFPRGTSSLVGMSNDGSSGYVVIADAIRLVKQ
ncbi:MAG: N-acetylmuramoyl-L-alanine amidase [Planctomycetota bacterium]